MAEEGTSKGAGATELLFAVIVIALLVNVFAGVPDFLQNQLGIDPTELGVGVTSPLTDNTPIGTKILQTSTGTLYGGPQTNPLGSIIRGATGTVTDGPVLQQGILWWRIRYDDDSVGWMSSDDIAIDNVRNRETLQSDTPRGTRVVNQQETTVHSAPGGFVSATTMVGERGVILDGPSTTDGTRYWRIRYANGVEGWVSEDDLKIDVERNRRAVTENTPLDSLVTTIERVDVWNRPGGTIVGTQRRGTIGFLVGGPAVMSFDRWWNIDFEEGADGWVSEQSLETQAAAAETISSIRSFLLTFSYSFSILFIVLIVYTTVRIWQLLPLEREIFGVEPDVMEPLGESDRDYTRNVRWERIEQYADSDDETNWRLAILEADIMLDELVESLGYQGETLGERMKMIEKSDFLTLDKAWEAHIVRNKIAHEGARFILTKRETRRVIGLFEEVFQEFRLI